MTRALLSAFDDRFVAQCAIARLVLAGFARQDVHFEAEIEAYLAELPRSVRRSFASAAGQAGTYADAERRGQPVVVVHVDDDGEAERAAALLRASGAYAIEDRRMGWCLLGEGR